MSGLRSPHRGKGQRGRLSGSPKKIKQIPFAKIAGGRHVKWGREGNIRRKEEICPASTSPHLNFQCLMIALDQGEHLTSAALWRLGLKNKMVFVFVLTSLLLLSSTVWAFRSWRQKHHPDGEGNTEIVPYKRVISHSPRPSSNQAPTKALFLPWDTSPSILAGNRGTSHILGTGVSPLVREAKCSSLGGAERGLHFSSPEFLYPLPTVSQTLEYPQNHLDDLLKHKLVSPTPPECLIQ